MGGPTEPDPQRKQTLPSSASAIQASLRSDQSVRAKADAANALDHLQLELLVHSSHRTRLWIEQPENIPTAIALKPYPRSKVAPLLKKYQLFK